MSYSRFQKSTLNPVDLKNVNYRNTQYEDYDEVKEGKAMDYTYNNYDGGKKFHQANDLHAAYQSREQNIMKNTLQAL